MGDGGEAASTAPWPAEADALSSFPSLKLRNWDQNQAASSGISLTYFTCKKKNLFCNICYLM